jgi:hypothetical protein
VPRRDGARGRNREWAAPASRVADIGHAGPVAWAHGMPHTWPVVRAEAREDIRHLGEHVLDKRCCCGHSGGLGRGRAASGHGMGGDGGA